MRLKKILNNNVAIISRGSHESIAYAPGIAFKRKIGEEVPENEITKLYVLDTKDRLEHLSYLLTHADEKTIDLVNKIVEFGEDTLGSRISDYVYLALLDHVTFAIKRSKKKQYIMSPLVWEVKKFYPKYYAIGIQAINWINEEVSSDFPVDEAIPISLHFINAQDENFNLNQKVNDLEILRDILNIIKYHFRVVFDENSMNYMRLITHLQYFIERIKETSGTEKQDNILFKQVKDIYPNAYAATKKIDEYVHKKFHQSLSKDEYTYLMIHINRVTNREDDDNEI